MEKWKPVWPQDCDESVATQSAAYRQGLAARQRWTERLGWLLPGVGVQAVLHRAAETDLLAQRAYQDAVADFHSLLRSFYYPYLFTERRVEATDFADLRRFSPKQADRDAPLASLLALIMLQQAPQPGSDRHWRCRTPGTTAEAERARDET